MHEVTINGKTIKVDDKRLLAIKVVYGKAVIDETPKVKEKKVLETDSKPNKN